MSEFEKSANGVMSKKETVSSSRDLLALGVELSGWPDMLESKGKVSLVRLVSLLSAWAEQGESVCVGTGTTAGRMRSLLVKCLPPFLAKSAIVC